MNAKMPAWKLYILIEIGILGAWLLNWLNQSVDWSALHSTPAVKALVELEVAWIIGSVAHWRMTGDPTPVEAVAVIAPAAAEPDVAERMRELDERLETHFAGLAALLRPEPRQPEPQPEPADREQPEPGPPRAPALPGERPPRRSIGVPPAPAAAAAAAAEIR